MKRMLTVLAGLLLIGASAQAGGLGVFGSYWDPDEGDDTWGVGARWRGGIDTFYFGLRGTYYDDVEDVLPVVDFEVIPVDASVGVQTDVNDEVQLYAGAGVTYYFLDADNADLDDEVGWFLEAGAELRVGPRMAIFGEVLWRSVEGTVEGDDLGEIDTNKVDIDLDGITVNVGLVFRR